MQRNIEGLILSKTPYRDKDLICRLLLRNGKKVALLFFGGRGGKRNSFASILEVGYLLRVVVSYQRQVEGQTLFLAKEWTPLWMHQKIRENHSAFTLLCLYLETLDKIAPEGHLYDKEGDQDLTGEFLGIFRIASNAFYYLEESLEKATFHLNTHFFLFFSKLVFELGVAPNLSHCVFCQQNLMDLDERSPLSFLSHQGGFSCLQCSQEKKEQEWGKDIFQFFAIVRFSKYSQYQDIHVPRSEIPRSVFHYFCYHFQLEEKKFRTLKYILPRHI